jgi:lysophospholipase L1-like esterase
VHRFIVGCVVALTWAGFICSGGVAQEKFIASEHWVASWATAQEMAPTEPDRPVLPPDVPRPNFQGQRPPAQRPMIPTALENETVRMTVHMSKGGKKVRIELSNAIGKKPVLLGAVHIALRATGSDIIPKTDHALTFGGHGEVSIEPGMLLISDTADLEVPSESDVEISLYVKSSGGGVTAHSLGLHTAGIADGDVSGNSTLTEKSTTLAYLWLSSVDVIAPKSEFAIVTLGDSITDGFKTTPNTDQAWPALLAKRLHEQHHAHAVSVLNQGISGNEVLHDGAGISALARFDRDVLGHPGVKWIVLLEGINDINIHGQHSNPGALSPDDLIAGYRQIIERAHMHGIRVMGATLTPEEGVWLAGPKGEATRNNVNQWIRTAGAFDAVVDFDKVIRDPQHPARMRPETDSGDHIHPNDLGNHDMADAFSLAAFSNF